MRNRKQQSDNNPQALLLTQFLLWKLNNKGILAYNKKRIHVCHRI